MLPEDSFLRQVPHALEPKARLILDAAGWAINSILISFSDLEAIAHRTPFDQRSDELDHRLFVHCWSIVDQCHMLRSLLQRLPSPQHEDIDEFISKTDIFTLLRNSMDHLPEKLGNLIKSEQLRAPLFGALSWIRVMPEDIVDGRITRYAACSISTTAVLAKETTWTGFNPATAENISGPVSNFQFEALDHSVDLSGLMTGIQVLLQHFENVAKPRVESNIRAGAKLRGLDPDETLKARGSGGLKIAMMIHRVRE